jgi:hypothetical protein
MLKTGSKRFFVDIFTSVNNFLSDNATKAVTCAVIKIADTNDSIHNAIYCQAIAAKTVATDNKTDFS